MKQFCTKIYLISQGRENVLFLPSNMAAMTSHENALYSIACSEQVNRENLLFICLFVCLFVC